MTFEEVWHGTREASSCEVYGYVHHPDARQLPAMASCRMPARSLSVGASVWDAAFAAGAAGNPLALASDFLIEFSLVAYPLYCAIKGFCKRLSGRNGGLHKAHGMLYRDAPSVSVH